MGYETIDAALRVWADRHHLPLYTEYKEIEVRSVELANQQGRSCQIWIDPPDKIGLIGIHVWDFKKKRRDFFVSSNDLPEYLENALKIAKEWSK